MSHVEQADETVAILGEAKAMCSMVELAMYEGGSCVDLDDVRYAVKGIMRIIDRADETVGALADELRKAEKGGAQ